MADREPTIKPFEPDLGSVSISDYDRLLAAWREKPAIGYVTRTTGLPAALARAVALTGVPRLGLPGFKGAKRLLKGETADQPEGPQATPASELAAVAQEVASFKQAESEMNWVKDRLAHYEGEARRLENELVRAKAGGVPEESLQTLRATFGRVVALETTLEHIGREAVAADKARKSAEEAAAARITMRSAVTSAAIVGHLAEKLLQGVEDGRIAMPETLTPQMILLLARSAEVSAVAVEKAMNIERKRSGRPEQTIGVHVSGLLDGCSDEELDYVARNGRLPARLAASVARATSDAPTDPPQDAEFVELDATH